ncbi:MAG: hypothetical protein ACOY93_08820 [Bacillota bacterium]
MKRAALLLLAAVAMIMARERAEKQPGVAFSSFQRQQGCRGGIVVVGGAGSDSDWSLHYYDAERDAITGSLNRSEVEEMLPGVRVTRMPGIGSGGEGLSLHLGDGVVMSTPAGICGLEGLKLR